MASGWVWTFCFLVCVQGIRALNNFTVGGQKGWHVPSGSDSYNLWAGNTRFQIGDILFFKYDQNVDSVLLVSSENYKTCNTMSPNKSFEDGSTSFKLYTHGPFYFISGNSSNCKKGEKLIVVVLAPCHNRQGSNCVNSSSPSTSPTISPIPSTSPSPSPKTSPIPSTSTSPSPRTSHGPTPAPISHPSLSPHSSTSSSPYSSPPAESPEIITPSSSSNYKSPAPAPVQSDSSSSATSLLNLVIPLMLVALLNTNL